MTCRERLEAYLHRQRVPFGIHQHATAYTAHDIAAREQVPERLVAKVVLVVADGAFAMLVLPAARRLDLERVAALLNAHEARLASEAELAQLFPDCEVGAMPPFGELYGLPVYVDRSLEQGGAVFFAAGSHSVAMSVAYPDFRRLAAPTMATFSAPPHQRHGAEEAPDPAPHAPAGREEHAARTILVPLDGSPFGEQALPLALALARRGGRAIALAHAHTLITPVITPLGAEIVSSSLDAELRGQETAYLHNVAGRLRAIWGGPISESILDAPIAAAISRHAATIGAELVVMSSHGRGGAARAWLGSVADQVVRHAPAPVLVVRPQEGEPDLTREPPLRNILIPLDGSPLAEQAIELALGLGLLAETRCTLLHVVAPIHRGFLIDGARPSIDVDAEMEAWRHATAYLTALAGRLQGRCLTVMTEVRGGPVAPTILEAAGSYASDLIVMTTHGRGGVARLLIGSVADKILRGAGVPLLVYRPPETGG